MRQWTSKILIVLAATFYIVGMIQGDMLNENQVIGCIWFGVLLLIVSIIFFINGALPLKNEIHTDKSIKLGFYFAVACLILSALEIPLWIIISGQFPPDNFSEMQSVGVAVTVGLSLFGPASPWIIQFRRFLIDTNRKMREEKKQKRNKR